MTVSPDAYFAEGVKALKNRLQLYDRNGHSYYDILGKPVGGNYHQVHIALLDTIHQMTGESVFSDYRDR